MEFENLTKCLDINPILHGFRATSAGKHCFSLCDDGALFVDGGPEAAWAA